jgi:hypothetical protein
LGRGEVNEYQVVVVEDRHGALRREVRGPVLADRCGETEPLLLDDTSHVRVDTTHLNGIAFAVSSRDQNRSDPCGERHPSRIAARISGACIFGRASIWDRGCSIRSQSMEESGMRRAPIRMGITLLVATLVASLAMPSMASDRSLRGRASPVAVTSLKAVKIINFAF